jgi:ribonuclease HII
VRFLAGADEAGRGALAGPLVAAAVLFDYEQLDPQAERSLATLDDSKLHSAAARQELFPEVIRAARRVAVVTRSVRAIETQGLHATNLAALGEALEDVCRDLADEVLCLVDGFTLPGLCRRQLAVRGGDRSSAAIAAASILAKVTRDRAMERASEIYPQWGFAEHVGYSTPDHRDAIRRHGVSPLHRLSFRSAAYAS